MQTDAALVLSDLAKEVLDHLHGQGSFEGALFE